MKRAATNDDSATRRCGVHGRLDALAGSDNGGVRTRRRGGRAQNQACDGPDGDDATDDSHTSPLVNMGSPQRASFPPSPIERPRTLAIAIA